MNQDTTLSRALAEFIVPKFISHYCDSCHGPIEDEEETVTLVEHLPSNYMRTEVDRGYCLDCLDELIKTRNRLRREDNKGCDKHRNVSLKTLDLVEAHQWEMHREAAWKITPFRLCRPSQTFCRTILAG